MVDLNIMFYTDLHFPNHRDYEFTFDPPNPARSSKGLSLLRDLIKKNVPKSARVNIHLINRNVTETGVSAPGSRKLTAELLEKYDEVWFFGYYQKDMPVFSPLSGGPENELRPKELKALEEWMCRGGVLIAGDHSDPVPPQYNLGRAFGKNIIRAGQMRKWEGPPTSNEAFNRNTQSPGEELSPDALDNANLQDDAAPQHIHLWIDEAGDKLPHKLFQGEHGIINILPDHKHEGELIIPKAQGKDWPEGPDGPDKPFFVAWGADNRFSFPNAKHFNEILSVYDGHKAGVGRIVAASTWHQYTNINLRHLPGGPNPRAPLNLIGEYYGNLAWWLAPEDKRNLIMFKMLDWLANYPEVLEELGAGIPAVGNAAEYAMRTEGQVRRIDEVVQTFFPEGLVAYKTPAIRTLIIGAFVEIYHSLMQQQVFRNQFKQNDPKVYYKIIRDSFTLALKMHMGEVANQLKSCRKILSSLNPFGEEIETALEIMTDKEEEMAIDQDELESRITPDSTHVEEADAVMILKQVAEGVVTVSHPYDHHPQKPPRVTVTPDGVIEFTIYHQLPKPGAPRTIRRYRGKLTPTSIYPRKARIHDGDGRYTTLGTWLVDPENEDQVIEDWINFSADDGGWVGFMPPT